MSLHSYVESPKYTTNPWVEGEKSIARTRAESAIAASGIRSRSSSRRRSNPGQNCGVAEPRSFVGAQTSRPANSSSSDPSEPAAGALGLSAWASTARPTRALATGASTSGPTVAREGGFSGMEGGAFREDAGSPSPSALFSAAASSSSPSLSPSPSNEPPSPSLMRMVSFFFPSSRVTPRPCATKGSMQSCAASRRSTYPAACSLSTSGASSKSRRNSPRGTNPRITGASPHCRRARRPRHRPSVGSDWSAPPSVEAPRTLPRNGSDSRLFHAHSGQPDAAACSSLCTSLTIAPPDGLLGSGFCTPPMAALGPPGIGHLNLIPSPARENFKSYRFASRSPIHLACGTATAMPSKLSLRLALASVSNPGKWVKLARSSHRLGRPGRFKG